MDEPPLRRDVNGEIQLAGSGAVTLRLVYDSVLGTGRQGAVFLGDILGRSNSRPIMKAAAKVPRAVEDPHGELCTEAEKHAKAWMDLDSVVLPFSFIAAHDATGTPAVLLTEIAKPLDAFLTEAGPLPDRHIKWIKAIARDVFQGHKDENMFVVRSHSLELAGIAVGDFEATQRGEERTDGSVVYYAGDYTWNNTSLRMASTVYEAIAGTGVPRETLRLDRQLCIYGDLFGVSEMGFGDVIDAVHHLMCFALDLMTSGRIDDIVDAEYINSLEWYRTILAGNAVLNRYGSEG